MKKTNYSYTIINVDTATSMANVLFTSTNTFYIDVIIPIPISDPENLDLLEREIKCRNPVQLWKSQEWLPFSVKLATPTPSEKVNAFLELEGKTKNLEHYDSGMITSGTITEVGDHYTRNLLRQDISNNSIGEI
jgi:hypothetical protein